MGRNDKDFVSPRHRHNFDQFRFQLEGDLNFARDGKMTPGMVGYFPEGASYGPQTSEATAMTIVLQFGGASGGGYLSRQETKQATNELKELGTFDGGVYRRNEGVPGKRNMDGFQAIWEHVNEPAAAISQAALSAADHDGLRRTTTGSPRRAIRAWTRSCSACSPSGAPRPAWSGSTPAPHCVPPDAAIYVACSGSGRVEQEPLRQYTTVFLEHGEAAAFTAETTAELLHLGLPDLRGLAAQPSHAVAAE